MLAIGDEAPDFELPEESGAASLWTLIESGPVLVYFYPADFTPVCTAQACMVRDAMGSDEWSGIDPMRVVGVSPQDERVHGRFREAKRLQQTLVADTDRSIARRYGVGGVLGVVKRSTFIVGADRRVLDRASGALWLSGHRRVVHRFASIAGADEPA